MAALLVDTSKVPRHGYSFLWADYVELMCLCSRNKMISKGNIDAQTQEAGDVQADSVEFGEEGEETEEMDDRVSRRWSDIHSRLTARSKQYVDWPFQLERNVLRSKFDKENPRHRLYAALLLASSLRLCIDNRRKEVTVRLRKYRFTGCVRHSMTCGKCVRLVHIKTCPVHIQGRCSKNSSNWLLIFKLCRSSQGSTMTQGIRQMEGLIWLLG